MVIDLSKYLNKVAVDQETKTADVDGGALWRDVDNATCPLGLATVAGTVNEVSTILCLPSNTDRQTGVAG
jgi:FAD/FMN-containing dehydrogenase